MTNPPVSEEQIKLFAELSAETTRLSLRRYVRRMTVGFLILLAGTAAQHVVSSHDASVARNAIVKSGTAVAVDGCNARYDDRQSIRGIFLTLEALNVRNATHQPAEAVQDAQEFYEGQLDKLPLPDCRKQQHILTDTPYPAIKIPVPKHP